MHRQLTDASLQIDVLDGLRGFAALIVIFSHTSNGGMYFFPFFDMRGTGKSGVFLFFLLSSFLLSRALIKNGESIFTVKSISNYWQRRFFRIYPLYIPYIFLILVLIPYVESSASYIFSDRLNDFVRHVFLLEGKGVVWSIAVEFKFYFVLPFIALVVYHFQVKFRFIYLCCIFFVALLFTQYVTPQSESYVNDIRLWPYMPIFLFGIFLAVVQSKIDELSDIGFIVLVLKVLGPISICCLMFMTPSVASLFFDAKPNNYFHRWFIQYAFLWSLVILYCINVGSVIQRIFKSKILKFFGLISFSLYLFHPIFISIVGTLKVAPYLNSWLVLISTTTVSYMSFVLVERPASKYVLYSKKQLKSFSN